MVRRAAGYLARHGPAAALDRWEDSGGITAFTLSAAIVALLIASELAASCGEGFTAGVLRDLADQWNASVESWLYRRGGALAEKVGVEGYYVRARTPGAPFAEHLDLEHLPPAELSPDALALVRFGLRAPDDPRVLNTVRVIDAVLRTDFVTGPAWRRYPGDRYGEHVDGAPFDGDGNGRPWPLLTGERAHYELARGDRARAIELLHAMEAFASATGNLPEQVWDQPDLPDHGLVLGKPSGSATPLGWTHGEYVKLCRSLADGCIFDLPEHALDRYVRHRVACAVTLWRVGDVIVPIRGALRIACFAPATVSWSADRWVSRHASRTSDTGLGLHIVDLPGGELRVRLAYDEPGDADTTELIFTSNEQPP
jgi:glucoamylase